MITKSQSFHTFYCSGDSASYLLEIVIVINLEGTLTQTRMGVSRITLFSEGHMKGHNISTFWGKTFL